MKSQRRHELQQNVLDAELGALIGFFKKRGTYILWGVLLVLLVTVVFMVVQRRKRAGLYDLRSRYEQLRQSDKVKPDARLQGLTELAVQDDDPRTAAMAMLDLAAEYSARFVQSDSKVSEQQKRQYAAEAENWYRKLINRFSKLPWALARGHLGFGKLAESRGEYAAAESSYQSILQMGDDAGPLRAEAEQRLKNLEIYRAEMPIRMATTLPATQPATRPAASQPATPPATQPATLPTTQPTTAPTTAPAS